jgi:hypothetical protein
MDEITEGWKIVEGQMENVVFYHGTSRRAWESIKATGFLDSMKFFKKTSLYKESKGNFLALEDHREIAESYVRKHNGVLLRIEYNPFEKSRSNNYKDQKAKGEGYCFERTPIAIDGRDGSSSRIIGPKV